MTDKITCITAKLKIWDEESSIEKYREAANIILTFNNYINQKLKTGYYILDMEWTCLRFYFE